MAHATDFLYCYSIIEANRRLDYAPKDAQQSGSKPGPGASRSNSSLYSPTMLSQSMHSELNTFFPFDPYRLPRSSSYIEGVYREWSSVAIDEDEDEDEEDEEEDGDEEDDGEGHVVERKFEAEGYSDEPRKQEEVLSGAIPVSSSRIGTGDSGDEGLGASFGGMSISPAHPGPVASLVTPMSVS